MSHCPGSTLEDFEAVQMVEARDPFLAEALAQLKASEQRTRAVGAVLEPLRQGIEDAIDEHRDNEDERSWRQDRGNIWSNYVDGNPEVKAKVDAILAECG